MPAFTLVIGVVSLCITIMGMVGGGVWIVATIKTTMSQMGHTIEELTAGVRDLTDRLNVIEMDHKETQQRIKALEQGKP